MQCQSTGFPTHNGGAPAANFAEVSNLTSTKIKPKKKTTKQFLQKLHSQEQKITQAKQDDPLAQAQAEQVDALIQTNNITNKIQDKTERD